MTVRCCFILGGVFWNIKYSEDSNRMASDVIVFGVAQILFALVLCCCYGCFHLWKVGQDQGKMDGKGKEMISTWPIQTKSLFNFWPRWRVSFDRTDASDNTIDETIQLGWILTRQSCLRHLLNQGDLLVLSFMSSLDDQAVYSVVNNYGSLIVRVLLQPTEGSSRLHFCTVVSSADDKDRSSSMVTYLYHVLLLDMYVGLCFVCFGVWFTWPLIYIVLGSRWAYSSVPLSLSLYCLYVPLIAINGILEAFVDAHADAKRLAGIQTWMVISSCVYLPLAITCTKQWGAPGMLASNMANTMMRLAYSARFTLGTIRNIYASKGQSHALKFPHKYALLSFLISLILNGFSYYVHIYDEQPSGYDLFIHMCVGCSLFVGCALVSVLYDRTVSARGRALLGHVLKRRHRQE